MKKLAPVLLVFLLKTSVLLSQVDTIPPVLYSHSLTPFHGNFCYSTIYDIDLIDSVSDNQTESDLIEFGIRKICTGEGFPSGSHMVDLQFDEYAQIEVWARDLAGNTTMQTVQVNMVLYGIACDPEYLLIAKMPVSSNNFDLLNGIHQVDFHVSAYHCLQDSFEEHYNSHHFGYFYNNGYAYPVGFGGQAVASKNTNPLNGVTTGDLLLITRHILGIEPLDSPYKIIAADANQDGKVTAYDIVVLRKLILGITDELPNGQSWRFIPRQYVFPNPADPFSSAFPTQINWQIDQSPGVFEFIGIKIGDVNFSADPTQ